MDKVAIANMMVGGVPSFVVRVGDDEIVIPDDDEHQEEIKGLLTGLSADVVSFLMLGDAMVDNTDLPKLTNDEVDEIVDWFEN